MYYNGVCLQSANGKGVMDEDYQTQTEKEEEEEEEDEQ